MFTLKITFLIAFFGKNMFSDLPYLSLKLFPSYDCSLDKIPSIVGSSIESTSSRSNMSRRLFLGDVITACVKKKPYGILSHASVNP